MAGRRIFVYGTLQFPAIARAVTGRSLAARPARLPGFARYRVRDAPYPGIVPRAGSGVPGLLYEGVDAAALARLDEFEGPMYRRERVAVELSRDGSRLHAEAYVVRPRWRSALCNADWDPDAFERDWHAAYLRACGEGRSAGEDP